MISRSRMRRRLVEGTAFHRDVQDDYQSTAQGDVTPEQGCIKPSGRRGRMDLHVRADAALDACIEIKRTDWDRMAAARVRPNVMRHARQVWDYVESLLADGREVSPGIIYARAPRSESRRSLIEGILSGRLISVVWRDRP